MDQSIFPYPLYLVISEADCKGRDMLWVAEKAIKGGVDIIQLREKNSCDEVFLEKAIALKNLTDQYQIPLIINDNLEVADKVDADGIHVGNSDVQPSIIDQKWNKESKIIGYSIEYLHQLENEEIEFSDYLGISPVFSTATKLDTVTEWGLAGIEKIRSLTTKPLVAIGRMNLNNIKDVINAGADSVALVSAICSAEDPEKAAYLLKNEILK